MLRAIHYDDDGKVTKEWIGFWNSLIFIASTAVWVGLAGYVVSKMKMFGYVSLSGVAVLFLIGIIGSFCPLGTSRD